MQCDSKNNQRCETDARIDHFHLVKIDRDMTECRRVNNMHLIRVRVKHLLNRSSAQECAEHVPCLTVGAV